ncbi:hypothetical protein MmiEs2_15480 [Methanimicrococcus stummii]|uniref:Peptidase S8/S53 domain-containing protein n=1 Tax=Methanimicrococcus stummii TaxID=3028294 RepID=A0AA96VBE2_9EURY|nr:S8 family peptidase [Methanimicrococcus sp. Es2]WNY29321.1 hypothetical protein MmiEs2_15480 [Methanimicrococcus sp. Es2]
MSNKKLPIKVFAKRDDIDLLQNEGKPPNEKPPTWFLFGDELRHRAGKLSKSLEEVSGYFKDQGDSDLSLLISAELYEKAFSKTHRGDIVNLFSTKSTDTPVLGLDPNNNLIVEIKSQLELDLLQSKLEDYENNTSSISCLEELDKYSPFIIFDKESDYKVKLVDFQDNKKNNVAQELFEETLQTMEFQYIKSNYTDKLVIYCLKNMTEEMLNLLRESRIFSYIYSIEPMPTYDFMIDSVSEEITLSAKSPDPSETYEIVGILDSGIASNKYLDSWIDSTQSPYLEEELDKSHGTAIASIVLYGDELEKKDLVKHKGLKLFDASVIPAKDQNEIDTLQNIKEAIQKNHEDIKIWNLSVSGKKSKIRSNFSDFAVAIDRLQNEYDILICKSSGNEINYNSQIYYDRYLSGGADSVNSLVVGSIAHHNNNISPFSRFGPAPSGIVKPDLVHYGGHAIEDKNSNGVRILSEDGAVTKSIGTSLSTPRVTSLAAGIQQRLEEPFDPLLIKALVIHSASYPDGLNLSIDERINQVGFGIPKNVEDILYNSPSEVTLILRDKIARGGYIDIMDFPMPNCLIKNGVYTGQIIITLVYKPILDHTQGSEYIQSNVEVKFGTFKNKKERDTTNPRIKNPFAREESQNLLVSHIYSKPKRNPAINEFIRKEGINKLYNENSYYSVKKYSIDLSCLTPKKMENHIGEDVNWYLFLNGFYRNHILKKASNDLVNLDQEFCLIITIRDPSQKSNVYEEMTEKLDSKNFWNSNIKLANEVEIPLSYNIQEN